MYVCMYACMYVCVCMYVCMCMYVGMYVCMCIYKSVLKCQIVKVDSYNLLPIRVLIFNETFTVITIISSTSGK